MLKTPSRRQCRLHRKNRPAQGFRAPLLCRGSIPGSTSPCLSRCSKRPCIRRPARRLFAPPQTPSRLFPLALPQKPLWAPNFADARSLPLVEEIEHKYPGDIALLHTISVRAVLSLARSRVGPAACASVALFYLSLRCYVCSILNRWS